MSDRRLCVVAFVHAMVRMIASDGKADGGVAVVAASLAVFRQRCTPGLKLDAFAWRGDGNASHGSVREAWTVRTALAAAFVTKLCFAVLTARPSAPLLAEDLVSGTPPVFSETSSYRPHP